MAKILFQWCTEVNFDFFLTLCLCSMYISFVKHTPCCTAHKKLFFLCEVFQYIVIVGVCISNKNCHRKGSNEVLITCQGSGQAIVPQFMAILRFLLIPFSHFVLIA